MENKRDQTEALIKKTAQRLFFKEGKFNATTQEIADAAGVNRTLINYYFRSRNTLFKICFDEAKELEIEKSKQILHSNFDFRKKIELFIDYSLEQNIEYPYLETYIVSQINQGEIYKREDAPELLTEFTESLEIEMKNGVIEKMEPIQFLLNLLSLVNFPLAMRPLLKENLNISDSAYHQIILDRKEIILKTLFK